MRITFISCLCITVLSIFGQTSTNSLSMRYNREAILLDFPYYIRNNDKKSIAYLKEEFKPGSEGFELFRAGYSKHKAGKIIQYASFGGFLIAAGLIKNRDSETVVLLTGGQLIVGLISFRIQLQGQKQIQRAVWIRNREALFGSGN